jgi:cytochrome c2
MNFKSIWIVFALGALLLTGCGAASASTPGNPAKGKVLFEQEEVHGAPGCITCHSVQPGEEVYGPSLAGVAARAASRLPETSAEAYLRQSILNPDAYVVEGFPSGEMYQDYAQMLSKAEINNLLAYLAQLK